MIFEQRPVSKEAVYMLTWTLVYEDSLSLTEIATFRNGVLIRTCKKVPQGNSYKLELVSCQFSTD